jgi:hypothetical protein
MATPLFSAGSNSQVGRQSEIFYNNTIPIVIGLAAPQV